MAEKIQIKAVDMVRSIRDQQAQMLKGKSKAEIIDFFRKAGEAARERSRRKAVMTPIWIIFAEATVWRLSRSMEVSDVYTNND